MSRGWKQDGDDWDVKSSAYGQKYRCRHCKRETLGFYYGREEQMHWKGCQKLAQQQEPKP